MDADASGETETAAAAEAMAAEAAKAHGEMQFMQLVATLDAPDDVVTDKGSVKAQVLKAIEDRHMATFYEQLAAKHGWAVDGALLERLRRANTEEVTRLDAAIADAREKFGDIEVFEKQRAKAEYLASVGDKEGALTAYAAVNPKVLSTGQKIDMAMAKARLALQHGDWAVAKERITEAKELNEKGGDWDRRNRLKVYEGLHAISVRDFKLASELFLDSVATFTAIEILDYKEFTFYTVLAALKSVDRVSLKKRVVDAPDILTVIHEIPHVGELLNAFYECRYRDFFQTLVDVYPTLQKDRFLSRHAAFYFREMRLAGYVQFLESYKSVTMAGMARTFGVSVPFLDGELSRFIASGRINAKIDAVSGIVETTRPDAKNAQYHAVIKSGDVLLNKVQKLSRVVAL